MTTMQNKFNLAALGIACSLGVGKHAVSKALFTDSLQPATRSVELISGKMVNLHVVPCDLPDLPAKHVALNSRCNRLLRIVLDEISNSIDHVKRVYKQNKIGLVLSTSTSGMLEAEIGFAKKLKDNQWPDGYMYEKQEIASPSIFAAQYLAIEGPAYTISTACSSSSKALLSASRLITAGICDAVICGGVDVISNVALNGFDSLELLSECGCNPLSRNRDGIALGEGAAVFLLTRHNHQGFHNVSLLGGAETSDAYHISAPNPNGHAIKEAIKKALVAASISTQDVLYINLHGTGTKLNDAIESQIVNEIFADSMCCSSTKALTGHTLGASGAIEAGLLWLALNSAKGNKILLPVHVWDGEWDPNLPKLKLVENSQQAFEFKSNSALMSNSFAFGGSNVSLVLGCNDE